MVLSNKKLKQRLRTAKAECLASNVSGKPDPHSKNEPLAHPESNSQLQDLLEAAKQRQRLSKREKRRKTKSFQKSEDANNREENKKVEKKKEVDLSVGEVANGEDCDKKIKRMKRKRKREKGDSGEEGLEEDGVIKVSKKAKKKNKKKKKEKMNAVAKSEQQKVDEAEKGTSGSQMNEEIANKVYVGGIPYYSTEEDIRSYFEGCGTITEVDCMTFPDSGKFRGIAIISFKTEAAAKRALALDGSDMGGFFLRIQAYRTTRSHKDPDFAPGIVEGYNRIYVGNLSWDITEDDLRKFFSDCKISSIRFGMDKETGEFRGYGHVDFSNKVSLMIALKLDQQIVCGRPIKISCAVPKKGAKIQPITLPTSDEADNGVPNSSSGKMRRRTCYECGEKGHISSDCPKKQTADPTNSNTS